jgi:hypothetical protein
MAYYDVDSKTAMGSVGITGNTLSAPTPQSATQGQMERLEKTLHHLSGRVSELSARLEPVLLPPRPQESGGGGDKGADVCPVAAHLHRLGGIANAAIGEVEDILNRLDV